MTQRLFLAVAIGAGLVAALLYYAGAQRVSVLVAAADLLPGRAIAATDLETRDLPPDAVPAGTLREPSAAIGRFTRAPIWRGQLVVAGAVADAPGAFDTGVPVPSGYRAVAIPVGAAQALGGAVVAGSRVDVIAVPTQGRAPAGRVTEVLVPAALVIDVRGEQGGRFEPPVAGRQPATALRDRLGSVVVAVGPTAEMWIADRMPTSTFVLALVADHR